MNLAEFGAEAERRHRILRLSETIRGENLRAVKFRAVKFRAEKFRDNMDYKDEVVVEDLVHLGVNFVTRASLIDASLLSLTLSKFIAWDKASLVDRCCRDLFRQMSAISVTSPGAKRRLSHIKSQVEIGLEERGPEPTLLRWRVLLRADSIIGAPRESESTLEWSRLALKRILDPESPGLSSWKGFDTNPMRLACRSAVLNAKESELAIALYERVDPKDPISMKASLRLIRRLWQASSSSWRSETEKSGRARSAKGQPTNEQFGEER